MQSRKEAQKLKDIICDCNLMFPDCVLVNPMSYTVCCPCLLGF